MPRSQDFDIFICYYGTSTSAINFCQAKRTCVVHSHFLQIQSRKVKATKWPNIGKKNTFWKPLCYLDLPDIFGHFWPLVWSSQVKIITVIKMTKWWEKCNVCYTTLSLWVMTEVKLVEMIVGEIVEDFWKILHLKMKGQVYSIKNYGQQYSFRTVIPVWCTLQKRFL